MPISISHTTSRNISFAGSRGDGLKTLACAYQCDCQKANEGLSGTSPAPVAGYRPDDYPLPAKLTQHCKRGYWRPWRGFLMLLSVCVAGKGTLDGRMWKH